MSAGSVAHRDDRRRTLRLQVLFNDKPRWKNPAGLALAERNDKRKSRAWKGARASRQRPEVSGSAESRQRRVNRPTDSRPGYVASTQERNAGSSGRTASAGSVSTTSRT